MAAKQIALIEIFQKAIDGILNALVTSIEFPVRMINKIPKEIKILILAIITLLALFCAAWLYKNRNKWQRYKT